MGNEKSRMRELRQEEGRERELKILIQKKKTKWNGITFRRVLHSRIPLKWWCEIAELSSNLNFLIQQQEMDFAPLKQIKNWLKHTTVAALEGLYH